MGKQITVTSFDKMEAASKKLKELSGIYTDIYKQLLQESETMGTAWEGADNQAFVQQISGFTDELKQMASKLDLAGDTLKQQVDNYKARQESNITEVKKLVN